MRVLCFLYPALMLAQSDDLSVRLRHVLVGSGHEQDAIAALSRKDYGRVEALLGSMKPFGATGRAEWLSVTGAIEFLDGQVKSAVASFQDAERLAPLNETDCFTMAMALVQLGSDEPARTVLARLAEQHPNRALYLYWLGRLDYDERRYQDAIARLEKAAALDGTSARIWDSLGLAFDMIGNSARALSALEKAAALNREQPRPTAWPPHDLGALLLRLDRPGEAVAALRESLRYDPALAQAHYHLGRALEKSGGNTEAIEEYKKAVAADTASTDACYSLAILLKKMHRESEAEEAFAEYRKRKQLTAGATPGETAYRLP